MSEAPGQSGRQVTLNAGVVQFLAGGLCSYPLFIAAVGVPSLLALAVFEESGSAALLIALVAAGFGAGACAALGRFLGSRPSVTWQAVLGLEAQPLYVLVKEALNSSMRHNGVGILLLPWAVAGAALALTFWIERRRRAPLLVAVEPQVQPEDSA